MSAAWFSVDQNYKEIALIKQKCHYGDIYYVYSPTPSVLCNNIHDDKEEQESYS